MNTKYPTLLSPITLAGTTFKNRIFSAPTSLAELGPGEKYCKENMEYYKLRAAGGAAVICIGEVIVDIDNGRSHPQQIGIDKPQNAQVFCQMVDCIHSQGAAASAELDHGGALCAPEFLGKMPAGPSAYVDDWGDEVRAMTEEEILHAAEMFGLAAANAKRYGFDMVTVHAGHGWLIHQFLSPLTNFRTDKWGGSMENRLRFLLLVVEEIRKNVGPKFPIEVRISGSERIEGGYGIETGVEIAKALDGKVDLIHVSAGTQQVDYSCVKMHPGPFESDMENLNLAAEIKKHVTKTPVLTVGAFNFPEQMEKVLADGTVDAIAIGRALVADPFLPKKIIEGREDEITPCLRCSDCMSSMIAFRGMRCAFNPIIGCEESIFLSDLGHKVTIVELQDDIAADCLKYPFLWLHHEVEERDIRVMTSASCTKVKEKSIVVKNADGIEEEVPCDTIVLAAGMRSRSDEVEALRGLVPTFYVVGDAKQAKNVMMANRDGYDAVVDLGL